jgi:hypothetical protein
MPLPKVEIQVQNGALGLVDPLADGVAGLVMTGVAVADKIALGESKKINSTQDAIDLGLDAAYDTTNTTNVYKSISDFYAQAGEGAELWIKIVAKTTTMEDMCDKANTIVKGLIADSGGTIRLIGVTRVADGAYSPTHADQLDPDVIAAAEKLQELYDEQAAEYKPFRAVLDARDFQGTISTLLNLKTSEFPCVGLVIGTDVESSLNASVGLALGRLAKNPVQRNIGRVKDGDLGIDASYLTGQDTPIEEYTPANLDLLHDKGFIFMRKYQGINGYFFNDDPTATANSDDFSSLARGRVIDKAILLAYSTYVNEILDDLAVTETGAIAPGVVKYYQSLIQARIDAEMTANSEISSVEVSIDPKQNVLSTNEVVVEVGITPKFYSKKIIVKLGFRNPANT